MITYYPLNKFLTEYTERNSDNEYRPVAVGRYGIRTRESIYSKELAKDYSKNKLIFQNTLTVGMGSVQIDIGVLTEDMIYSVSPAYHTYRIEGINSDYLRYCLECRNQDMFVRYVKKGSRQGKTIDLNRWLTYEIPVCSEIEQKQVVEKIGHVNGLIEAAQTQLAKLDELVKSRFIEMFGDPITNPMGWKTEKAENHIDLLSGYPFDSSQYTESGINICGGLIIMPQRIDWNDCKHWGSIEGYEEYTLQENDIVMALDRPWITEGFKIAMVDANHLPALLIQRTARIRATDINQQYLLFSFMIGGFDKHCNVTGSLVPHISSKDIRSFTIMLPPLELQKQFAAFVEQTDKSKLAVQQSLEKLETLKKSLMQNYFGG